MGKYLNVPITPMSSVTLPMSSLNGLDRLDTCIEYVYGSKPMIYYTKDDYSKLEKYIINENATILFWSDKTKTVSKRHKDDKFDKEMGFLLAYFYKKFNGSKSSMKRVLKCVEEKQLKTFVFEFYVNDTKQTSEKARKYLKNLEVDKEKTK